VKDADGTITGLRWLDDDGVSLRTAVIINISVAVW
jgi:hypothetical protein